MDSVIVIIYYIYNINFYYIYNINLKLADWGFLDNMLRGHNFSVRFCGWIRACATSPTYCITLNGDVRGFFPGMQGLRQGDPLSPHYSVLCIEYVSRLFKARIDDFEYNFHPNCAMHNITH